MSCPRFGSHNLPSLDINRFGHHSCLDPVTRIGTGKRTVHLAMPCKVAPETALPAVPETALALLPGICILAKAT
eukprot:16433284-Heterocapsa_arctica.AAC.2